MDDLRTALDTPLSASALLELLEAQYVDTENLEWKGILFEAIAELQKKTMYGADKPVWMRKGKRFAALINFIEEGRLNPPLETIFDDTYKEP